MTMGRRSMSGLLWLERFALLGQFEKVWIIVEILVCGTKFLTGVHGKIDVLILVGCVKTGDTSLTTTKHWVQNIMLMWIPAILHPTKQREKLSFIKNTIAFGINNFEEVVHQIVLVLHVKILAEEHKMFNFALAIAINVKESKSILWRTKINPKLLNDGLKKQLKLVRRIIRETVHIEF